MILLGSAGYDPSKPRVMKLRVDGEVTCDVYAYALGYELLVDDENAYGR